MVSTCRGPTEEPGSTQLMFHEEASEEGDDKPVPQESMYCKEQLTNGVEEFCFEELRSQRYALFQRHEVKEKIRRLHDLGEKLEREVEEKQRLLLLRRSQTTAMDKVDEGGPDEIRNWPAAEPFHICSDSSSPTPNGAGRPRLNPKYNDVFQRPGETGPSIKIQLPCPGGAVASENSHAVKGTWAGRLSLTEAVVGGVQNKTLCCSPDNTRDFAGSAHLVSTPCASRAPSSGPGHQGSVSQEQGGSANKLSPIEEASLEAFSCLSHAVHSSTDDSHNPETDKGPLPKDPCSADTRKRLLDQAKVSSFPGFHTVGTPLPDMDQDTRLSLGSEVVFLHTKVQEEDGFRVFSGLSQGNHVVLKVERSVLPWDFYVVSQLRKRLSPNSGRLPHVRCFLFLDGCVTLYTLPQHQRLSEWAGLSLEGGVASVVQSLLLMMRTFHSCSLLLGALRTDSLLLTHGDSDDSLLCVDLRHSLDLDLQTDLTSASRVPAALGYIRQGVLKTTDSPYQVDLVCLAEEVHLLLTKRKMVLVEVEDGWMVEEEDSWMVEDGWMVEQPGSYSRFSKSSWRTFFHLLLNSSGHSSVSVLSRLLDVLVAMTPEDRRDSWWLP
ncbi:hypothetical protein NHX12_026066 [Muraenolepis orangiensis]|uniref:Uncharacterized protein n=1 Tax=Muraenolepis orangiensis TaxID=630683 RepID=A0A9Q0EJN5_9TELE|nr:hypothetical protein NHX12_026066 [Muraenolepis orangiensis]